MRKYVIYSPGPYDHLKLEEHPDPKPGPGEVCVKTKAIGVNYADSIVRWGVYKSAKEYVGWPITPGFEFSGEVSAVGANVKNTKVGDRVFGITRFSAYATHVVVPENQVFPMPKKLSFEQAAGFPAVHLTAYHALLQNVILRPGATILVHSAAGGVGSALLQVGRLKGYKMVGVVGSKHKVEVAKTFGADHVIDKSSEDLWARAKAIEPAGYDLILDANGHTTLFDGLAHLRPTGKIVTYGYHSMLPNSSGGGSGKLNYLKAAWGLWRLPKINPTELCDSNKGIFGFNISFLFERRDFIEQGLTELMNWVETEKIRPPQVTTFPFEKAAEAQARIESGQTTGKLVLTT